MDTAPILELDVTSWRNAPAPDPADLRGRVVLVKTFQMLCPGCISYGLPQAQRVHRSYDRSQVVVLGLHTVFEHHAVMGPDALDVFLHEYRLEFPVAVDRHDGDPIPVTMRRYGLQGTPSTLVVDRAGRVRHTMFGAVEDLALGTMLGALLTEPAPTVEPVPTTEGAESATGAVCRPGDGCD